MLTEEKMKALKATSLKLRHEILDMIGPDGGTGHWGGSSSACDLITALYFYKMKFDGSNPVWEGRDRFILSKGHAALAQYAALAELGVIAREELNTVKVCGSRLQGHPDLSKTPGIEANTGSLGMGLSQALGMALSLNEGQRVYVLLGDGEQDEGQVWEAAMAAASYECSNLTVIIDRNTIQATDTNEKVMKLGDVGNKWNAFGWRVIEIDGHNFVHICAALDTPTDNRPTVIIASTIKGKGVSFAENKAAWHNGSFTHAQFIKAHTDLDVFYRASELWQYRQPAPAAEKPAPAENMQSQRRVYGETLVELGRTMPELAVLEADLSKSTMGSLFGAAYPERFYEMGIAEQNMASTAAGMSLCGRVPFMASFAVFSTGRCYDQLRSNVCIPGLNVKVCGSSAGLSDYGDGSTHQSVDDIALMRVLPNMQVFVPCDGPQTAAIVKYMAANKGPMYIRVSRNELPTVTAGEFEPGMVYTLREGSDAVLFACGTMVSAALKAADLLASEGISLKVVNVPSIKPLNTDSLIAARGDIKAAFTAEEHSVIGGLGSAVCEIMGGIRRLGIEDKFGTSGSNYASLLEHYGLRPEDLAAAVKAAVK